MSNPLSEDVLEEILAAYAADERLPSDKAIRELAASAGKLEQAVKNDYIRAYKDAGGEDDDPFGLPAGEKS
jgi:hypothetical protein